MRRRGNFDGEGGPWLHVRCVVEVRKRKVMAVP
jgi:hypothetical protein